MKFLHVSTGDNRGAFSGAYRLHRNLIEQGHESFMLVGSKQTNDPTVIAPTKFIQACRRLIVKLTNQLLKLACGRDNRNRHTIALNAGIVPIRSLLKQLPSYRPDLIIVYYVGDFLSPAQLSRIQEYYQAPVAIYLMDMGMLTGACHYAWDCAGYLENCKNCPASRSKLLKKWIGYKWVEKERSFAQIKPTIVAGSGWLSRQAKDSRLSGNLLRTETLIGINSELYSPGVKGELREKFGLPQNNLVLYFGAQNLDDTRKGFRYLIEALGYLFSSLSIEEQEKICLFTVGALNPALTNKLPFKHVHISYISDPSLFAKTYAAADVFICPSIEDSGPMMINESMMSGTPVVAFEMGVAVDLVINGETGYRVPLKDAHALFSAMAEFIRLPSEERSRMSSACRELGLEKCSLTGQVQAFEDLALNLNRDSSARL